MLRSGFTLLGTGCHFRKTVKKQLAAVLKKLVKNYSSLPFFHFPSKFEKTYKKLKKKGSILTQNIEVENESTFGNTRGDICFCCHYWAQQLQNISKLKKHIIFRHCKYGQGTQGSGTKPGTQKGARSGAWASPWVPWPIWSLASGFPAHICKADA